MIARPRLFQQQGFTLTEILVGMAIGLMTVLAIMQVMSSFEGQKRTTSGTSDTQTNGSIALYTIQRMVQSAGFELSTYSTYFRPLNCDPEPTATVGGVAGVGIFPISIVDGGTAAGATDIITVRGSLLPPSTAALTGQSVAGMPTVVTQLLASSNLGVNNTLGCQVGDLALSMQSSTVFPSPTCTLGTVTAIVSTGQVTLSSTTGIGVGDGLTCLKNWTQRIYSIDAASGSLMENGVIITPGIVQLHAQYGLSATADSNTISSWVSASGSNWVTPNVTNRKLIKAVRIAVIARSGLYEKDVVSTACSSTTAASPTGVCAWAGTATSPAPSVILSNDPNWDHYRYRVYETVMPLRNNIWGMNTL